MTHNPVADPRADERTLLDRARGGDAQACRTLVERYEPVVAATVIGMLGRGDDADDVGQETFIRFFNALGEFRGDASVKTYLQKIAMNLSLNALKRRQRVASRFVSIDDDESGVPELAASTTGEHRAQEAKTIVDAALDQLPPKHRAVVVLRMIDGCSTREAAAALGVPEGTVLSRLARGMKQLQELLAPSVGRAAAPAEG
ncbi:MAG: RNA polymerase sigma factor [Verrucomicrobiota bacterium]